MKIKNLYTPPSVEVYAVFIQRPLALSYNDTEQTETLHWDLDEEDL